MLIVIVIIGILSAALIPRLQSMQWRARDSERKVDLQQIWMWIAIYESDNWQYPYGNSAGWWNCAIYQPPTYPTCVVNSTHSINRILEITWYVTSLPRDPINHSPANSTIYTSVRWFTTGSMYGYQAVNSRQWYSLTTRLENKTDSDRCAIKAYTYFSTVGAATCTSTFPDIYVLNGGLTQ